MGGEERPITVKLVGGRKTNDGVGERMTTDKTATEIIRMHL